jgi:hypothetical protein
MGFEVKAISESDWEILKENSQILKAISSRPLFRAVNEDTKDFLIEISKPYSHREGDWIIRCVFAFMHHETHVSIANARNSKFEVNWHVWKDIKEVEIIEFNKSLVSAIVALFGFNGNSIMLYVGGNPFVEIPIDELILHFDSRIDFFCSTERLRITEKYIEKLTEGKKSLFKWRFFLTKWKGIPKYNKVDHDLIRSLESFFINPKHKTLLFRHLDEGGSRYCEDTKRVLNYLRNSAL